MFEININSRIFKMIVVCSLYVLVVTPSFAASSHIVANVINVGTLGNGALFVNLDTVIDEPACPSARLNIGNNRPETSKSIMSIALTAQVSGNKIALMSNGFELGTPTLDDSAGTYFFLQ